MLTWARRDCGCWRIRYQSLAVEILRSCLFQLPFVASHCQGLLHANGAIHSTCFNKERMLRRWFTYVQRRSTEYELMFWNGKGAPTSGRSSRAAALPVFSVSIATWNNDYLHVCVVELSNWHTAEDDTRSEVRRVYSGTGRTSLRRQERVHISREPCWSFRHKHNVETISLRSYNHRVLRVSHARSPQI